MESSDICSSCCSVLFYSEQWDSIYCPTCNEWKEEKVCKPEDNETRIECYFECWNRPKRPINDT